MTDKRSRRTRAELRDLMMAAGRDVLFDIEPSIGFEQLTYSAVFARLQDHYGQKVTTASVHERLWQSQRDFQLDVVADALQESLPVTPDEAMLQAAAVISQLDLTTPARRRYALQSAIRQTSFMLSTAELSPAIELANTVRFRLWSLGPSRPETAGFLEAITEIRTQSTNQYIAVVRQIMAIIGLQVRSDAGDPEEALQAIAILGNAARVGLRTDVLDASHTTRKLPSGPNGELEEWYGDALALWAVVRSTLELSGEELSDDDRRL